MKDFGIDCIVEGEAEKVIGQLINTTLQGETLPQRRDVVMQGMGLMHDNRIVPAGTLIVGLHEETEDDIIKTQEMVDDLQDIRCLITQLFFVPLGILKDKGWFKDTKLHKLHQELMIQSANHAFKWINDLIYISFNNQWYHPITRNIYKTFVALAKHKVNKIGIN